MGHEARRDTLYATCFLVIKAKKSDVQLQRPCKTKQRWGEAETCQTLGVIGREPGFTHRFPGDHAQSMALAAGKRRRQGSTRTQRLKAQRRGKREDGNLGVMLGLGVPDTDIAQ